MGAEGELHAFPSSPMVEKHSNEKIESTGLLKLMVILQRGTGLLEHLDICSIPP
jgi:hypothetical protein